MSRPRRRSASLSCTATLQRQMPETALAARDALNQGRRLARYLPRVPTGAFASKSPQASHPNPTARPPSHTTTDMDMRAAHRPCQSRSNTTRPQAVRSGVLRGTHGCQRSPARRDRPAQGRDHRKAPGPWKSAKKPQWETLKWISRYNSKRPHSTNHTGDRW